MTTKTKQSKQSGHFHLIVALIVVVVVVAAVGWLIYQRQHRASKVTDAATRAQLQQTAAELKQVDLGSVQKAVNSASSVQDSAKFQKSK